MKNIRGVVFYAVKSVCYIVLFAAVFLLCLNFFNSFYKGSFISLDLSAEGMNDAPFEVYCAHGGGEGFDIAARDDIPVSSEDGRLSINGRFRLSAPDASRLRLDLGSSINAKITINKIEYITDGASFEADLASAAKSDTNNDTDAEYADGALVLTVTGADPYIIIDDIKPVPGRNLNGIFAALAALVFVFAANRYVKLKSIYTMAADMYLSRRLILSLAVNDFKTKYSGSYFGTIWAFIQPICTILVFWFVFQVGFRSNDVGDVAFILWFMAGLIPWFFFSEAWMGATMALMEYSYLVKKVVFKIHILPLVKIISGLFVHVFFILFMLGFYLVYGEKPDIYWLQILYYSFCMVLLVTALSYITSALVVFFRDLGQIMNIVLQFGMWLTPIMWSINMVPGGLMWVFKLNPMYYIVQGYRESLIYHIPFYDNVKQTLYFWIVLLILMLAGCVLYKKLKPHFADVL